MLRYQVLSEPGTGIRLLSKSLMSPRASSDYLTPKHLVVPSSKENTAFTFPSQLLPHISSDITAASTRSPSPDMDSQHQGSWTHKHILSVDQFNRGQVLPTTYCIPFHTTQLLGEYSC